MAGRGRGRGRGRGKGISTSQLSQPNRSPILTPSPDSQTGHALISSSTCNTRPTHSLSSGSQENSKQIPSPHSQTRPAATPSPNSQNGQTPNPSPHSQTRPTATPSPNSQNGQTPNPSPHSQIGTCRDLPGNHSDNISIETQSGVQSSAPTNIRWGVKDVDGLIWIKPDGLDFYPSPSQVTRRITKIFKRKFEGSWTSWTKVDKLVRDMWFADFKSIYKWLPEDENDIRKSFESKGSSSLKNAFNKLRENKDNGNWLHADHLEQLKIQWQNPEWKEKARKNQENRQPKEGLNKHSGGSISAKEHAKRMRVELNREPNYYELYERLHKPKGNPTEFFTEEQAKIGEEYVKRIAERESQIGEGSSSQQCDNDIFLDVVGGVNKKGRIFGLGSQGSKIVASSTISSIRQDEVTSEEVATMKATIQALQDELQQKDQQWEQRFISMTQQWE